MTLASMEHYRVFYHVAKAGSLSRAASELYITQPAVSHAIKQLENRLGGQVFFRTPKGVTLTPEGEVLFTYVEQAYNFLLTAEHKLADMQNLFSGEIKIGASDTLCKHYLLPHLEHFHHTYPDVSIQVTNRTTPETIQLLKQGRVDLGIVNLPIEDEQLIIREGMEIQDCFVVGERYREWARSPLSLDELATCPLILLERGSNSREYIDHFFNGYGISLSPEIELGSMDLLTQFAQSGLGVSCVIEPFIEAELHDQRLYKLKIETPIPPRHIGLVTLKHVPLSPATKKLMEGMRFICT